MRINVITKSIVLVPEDSFDYFFNPVTGYYIHASRIVYNNPVWVPEYFTEEV